MTLTPEAMNTILWWIFAGIAVIGVYLIFVGAFVLIWSALHHKEEPKPTVWRKPAPSPYDLSKVGGLTRRAK